MKLAVYEPSSSTATQADGTATPASDTALTATELTTALADRGIDLVDPPAADLLLTVGSDGLRAAVAADAEQPLLAVGTDAPWSLEATSMDALAETLSHLPTESVAALPTRRHRRLQVSVGETTATAVSDCALLTTQPARISEYAVSTDAATTAEFRSDGVVVATPLGSEGYARAAGGPRLAPDTGLAVVPIAPFAMQADSLVCHPPLTLTVERDTEVTVFADDRRIAAGGTELSVAVSLGSPFSVVDGRRVADEG